MKTMCYVVLDKKNNDLAVWRMGMARSASDLGGEWVL
jgi:hypothetical protein